MRDALAELAPFVAALRIDDADRVTLAGRAVHRVPGERSPAEQLIADLTICTYAQAYVQRFGSPAAAIQPADRTAALAAANATGATIQDGWQVVDLRPDGSVVATRHGRELRVPPGRYLVVDRVTPPAPGALLRVAFPSGSATIQPGFYHSFGAAPRDREESGALVRFYFNATCTGGPALTALLTASLNRYAIPFDFKILTAAASYYRRDAAVLYVAASLASVVETVLAAQLPAIAATLSDDVPLFTRRLAAGIGLAEDPGEPQQSFGTVRCRLVARALVAARIGDHFDAPAFDAAVVRLFDEHGLAIAAPWLNPGSTDRYGKSFGAAAA